MLLIENTFDEIEVCLQPQFSHEKICILMIIALWLLWDSFVAILLLSTITWVLIYNKNYILSLTEQYTVIYKVNFYQQVGTISLNDVKM